MMFPEHKFYTSAIVGGILPIALGTALANKRNNVKKHVFAFVGDMTAETGDFHLCRKYAINHDLPITFIIENNNQSVGTPTQVVWGTNKEYVLHEPTMPAIIDAKTWEYKFNATYPHVGCGRWITF